MRLFDLFRSRSVPAEPPGVARRPTVSFDRRQVTAEVRGDIQAAITELPVIPTQLRPWLFDIAVESVIRGRDIAMLAKPLAEAGIPGIGRPQAAAIARGIHNRATALINKNRQLGIGITEAKWLHSGGACFDRMEGKERLAEAHAAAAGQVYKVADGLFIGGSATWPGRDFGCKCVSIPIIKGFIP